MSASQSQALDAVAFQLAAALERYDDETTAMLESWPDLERYCAMSEQIETVRLYSSSLPEVQVQWVELLIAHAELVHVLWRMQYGDGGNLREQVADVRDRHADCIAALRNRCVRILAATSRSASGGR
jgi:hypothetical protein